MSRIGTGRRRPRIIPADGGLALAIPARYEPRQRARTAPEYPGLPGSLSASPGRVARLRAFGAERLVGRGERATAANHVPTSLRTPPAPVILGPMSDVTRILSAIDQGDPSAAEQLLPLVYDELRKLAAARMAEEKPGQTLTATALVHEAYLRLVGGEHPQDWNGRGHFFAAAARAMRRILVNRARDKGRLKRGGGRRHVELADLSDPLAAPPDDLLDLDDALERLAV